MKVLKVVLIALITIFSLSTSRAQVSIRARIGQRPVHRRVVVVHRPVYRHRYYAHHRWYRRPYYRHHYRHY